MKKEETIESLCNLLIDNKNEIVKKITAFKEKVENSVNAQCDMTILHRITCWYDNKKSFNEVFWKFDGKFSLCYTIEDNKNKVITKIKLDEWSIQELQKIVTSYEQFLLDLIIRLKAKNEKQQLLMKKIDNILAVL